jgi:predicted nucleic acid-binding protein
MHSELRAGVNSHPHLQRALDCLGELVPVVGLDKTLTTAVGELTPRLDPGEAQAFAVADGYGGLLVTDDGPARALARENDVSVTGSIGVLVRAVDEGHVSESEADRWLKRWVDETDFRAPSREFSAYL